MENRPALTSKAALQGRPLRNSRAPKRRGERLIDEINPSALSFSLLSLLPQENDPNLFSVNALRFRGGDAKPVTS
jgi:hypothetical protein